MSGIVRRVVEELPSRRNLWRWAWLVLTILIVILGILFVRNKTPGKQGRQSPVKRELLRGQQAIGRHQTVVEIWAVPSSREEENLRNLPESEVLVSSSQAKYPDHLGLL